MLWLKKCAVAVVVALLPLTGCSASPSPGPDLPSPACTGEACNGKEVTEVRCDRGVVSTIASKVISSTEAARGKLEIHKANPSVCQDVYWGWFDPDDDNKTGYSLTIKMGDVTSAVQESESGNPAITAWTTVVYDPQPRKELTVCLMSGVVSGAKTCISATPK